jgi:dihydrodipicolinate synthase/N-acetylneuraminate lyase
MPQSAATGRFPFSWGDHLILDALELGASGAVTACANVAPRALWNFTKHFVPGIARKRAVCRIS